MVPLVEQARRLRVSALAGQAQRRVAVLIGPNGVHLGLQVQGRVLCPPVEQGTHQSVGQGQGVTTSASRYRDGFSALQWSQARNHESEVSGDHMEGREDQILYFRCGMRYVG